MGEKEEERGEEYGGEGGEVWEEREKRGDVKPAEKLYELSENHSNAA